MRELSEQEMMELDAWIERNVFGFHVKYEGKVPYCCDNENSTWDSRYHVVRQFTSSTAASRELEKKCAEKLEGNVNEASMYINKDGVEWTVGLANEFDGPEATAFTLELAIAIFARKLFTKESKF